MRQVSGYSRVRQSDFSDRTSQPGPLVVVVRVRMVGQRAESGVNSLVSVAFSDGGVWRVSLPLLAVCTEEAIDMDASLGRLVSSIEFITYTNELTPVRTTSADVARNALDGIGKVTKVIHRRQLYSSVWIASNVAQQSRKVSYPLRGQAPKWITWMCYSESMETPIIRVKNSPSLAVYRRIAVTFSVLTLVVVALVVYVVLLRGEIVVLSKSEEVRTELAVDVVAPSIDDSMNGAIPGAITSLEDALTRSFPSTSVVKVQVPAKGQVRIASSLSRPQTLIASTRLQMEDGTLYRVKKTVVVPAWGGVIAEVYADDLTKAPPQGEVTFIIPGLNPETQKLFKAVSIGSLAGGEKDVRMVTAGDMQSAEEVLKNELVGTLTGRVREKAKADGASMGGEILDFATIRRVSDVEVGSDVDAFTLTVTVRATAVHYDDKTLDAMVRAALIDKLSYDKTLRSVVDGSTKVEVQSLDVVAGKATLKVTAAGASMLSKDSPSFSKEKILGVTVEAATSYLQGIDGVASASVRTTPWGASRLPSVPDHINIEVR